MIRVSDDNHCNRQFCYSLCTLSVSLAGCERERHSHFLMFNILFIFFSCAMLFYEDSDDDDGATRIHANVSGGVVMHAHKTHAECNYKSLVCGAAAFAFCFPFIHSDK